MDALAIIVAVEGAVVAILVARSNHLNAVRARQLSLQTYFDAWDKTLREWASSVVDEIDNAIELTRLDPARLPADEFFGRRLRSFRILSSLGDKGRWFFSNVSREEIGTQKEAAYRGLRRDVLDPIIEAYRLTKSLSYSADAMSVNPAIRKSLVAQKKKFVSKVQIALDPEQREKDRAALKAF